MKDELEPRVMTGPPRGEIVRLPHGAVYKLRPPHTVASVRADARAAEGRKKPLLCRLHLHWRERIGDVYIPEDSMSEAIAVLIVTTYTSALVRCRRCRAIQEHE